MFSTADRFKTRAEVDDDLGLLRDPQARDCLKQAVIEQIAADLPAGVRVTASALDFTAHPVGAPGNVVGLLTGSISATGVRQATVYLNFAFLTGTRLEANVVAISANQPIPHGVWNTALTAVANRSARTG